MNLNSHEPLHPVVKKVLTVIQLSVGAALA